jgi:hypothetical protein
MAEMEKAKVPMGEVIPPKKDLEVFTKEQLDKVIAQVVSVYDEKITQLTDKFDKLAATYEKDDTVKYLKRRGEEIDRSVQVLGPRVDMGPSDPMSALSSEFSTDKNKYYRFVNNHKEIRSLRRYQGYEPVLDKEGNEVRYMDGVLMSMPLAKHDETIVAPREARKNVSKKNIEENFHQRASGQGVETFGTISRGIKTDA